MDNKKYMGVAKFLGSACTVAIVTELVYHLIKKYKPFDSYFSSKKPKEVSRTIFFPDSQVACKDHFTLRHGCTNQRCGFSHDPDSSYGQLLRFLQSARSTMDVCVFVLTCADFADIMIDLHHRGVVIRIVTDGEQIAASGSQINKLRAQGIQVRHNSSSYHMHHKFAIVDGNHLLNGSFNWTRQAITGNHENLNITNSPRLLAAYQGEFNKLWLDFNPK